MNNLSVSMMIDNVKKSSKLTIPPRIPSVWIPDNRTNKCYDCKQVFNIFYRKHHCRVCGRIFCYNCSNNYQEIPQYIPTAKQPTINTKRRLCNNCNNNINNTKNVNHLILILSLLPVTIQDIICKLRILNTEWKNATESIISIYRGIQYKCSNQIWNNIEKNLLLNHYLEFSGHSILMVKSIIGLYKLNVNIDNIVQHFLTSNKHTKCKHMLCSRNCNNELSCFDVIELLYCEDLLKDNNIIIKLIGQIFTKIDIRYHYIFLPIWINTPYSDNLKQLMLDYLFPISCNDLQMTYCFYFEIKKHNKLVYFCNRFFDLLDKKSQSMIQNTELFLQYIYELNECDINNIINTKKVLLPWNCNKQIISIDYNNIVYLKSSSKPILIPIIIKYKNKKYLEHILLKKENVDKDRFAIIIMKCLQIICPELKFITYDIFPVNENYGLINTIQDTTTLYNVKYLHKISLQNYIISKNQDLSSRTLRIRFAQSCAASCILCYVLGVGDRHLENILITHSGIILHIDFSYLFGNDPKFSNCEMKITTDMLDMLGGVNSEEYVYFQHICQTSYNKIRKFAPFWYQIFKYLNKFSDINLNIIESHIRDRLIPGEFDTDPSMQIINILQKNTNSWLDSISDITHNLKNNFMNYF